MDSFQSIVREKQRPPKMTAIFLLLQILFQNPFSFSVATLYVGPRPVTRICIEKGPTGRFKAILTPRLQSRRRQVTERSPLVTSSRPQREIVSGGTIHVSFKKKKKKKNSSKDNAWLGEIKDRRRACRARKPTSANSEDKGVVRNRWGRDCRSNGGILQPPTCTTPSNHDRLLHLLRQRCHHQVQSVCVCVCVQGGKKKS